MTGSARNHFGSSVVASPRGAIIAQANDTGEDMAVGDIDVSVIPELRAMWGYYRDRRPDLYGPLAESRAACGIYRLLSPSGFS